MNRRTLVAAAAAGGFALAAGVAVARDDTPTPTTARPASMPPRVVGLMPGEIAPDRSAGGIRVAIPGSDVIAAKADDPHGGPPWVVRTFERRTVGGRGRVPCAQLGRFVDGEVAWVMPGASRAQKLPLAVTETTTCATTAPIAEQLGVGIGGLPTRAVNDPSARIGTTVVWGVVNGPAKSARIEHPNFGGPVRVHRRAILEVRSGPVAQSYIRLVVTDRDGGERGAVPPAFYGSDAGLAVAPPPVRAGRTFRVGGRYYARERPDPSTYPRSRSVEQPPQFRLAARVGRTTDGPPLAIFARVDRSGHSCVTGAVPSVGGQPATPVGRNTGLVAQLPQSCTPLPEWADWMPVVLGAGWESGHERELEGTPAGATRSRRHTEDRISDDSGSLTIGTPPGTRYLEVTSPVGVQVVRVTPGRVTTVAWRGQPEVRKALQPEVRRLPGGRWSVPGPVVSFIAYDAHWKQLGEPGTTSPTITWAVRKRHAAQLRRAKGDRQRSAPVGRPAPTAP